MVISAWQVQEKVILCYWIYITNEMEKRYLEWILLHLLLYLFPISLIQCYEKSRSALLAETFTYKERLTSGAVFLLDERNILVSQFSYKNLALKNLGSRHNKWFKGIQRKSNQLIDLQYENGKEAQIQGAYLGQNVYLKVPSTSSVTLKDFSGIAIVNERDEIKTLVEINASDVENLTLAKATPLWNGGSFIFRYPKCCPIGEFSIAEEEQYRCIPLHENLILSSHFPVHEIIDDMYNTDAFENVTYEPFYFNRNMCAMITFARNENVTLLADLQFAVPQHPNSKLSCIDYVQSADSPNHLDELVFTCIDDLNFNSSGSIGIPSQIAVFNLLAVCFIAVIL